MAKGKLTLTLGRNLGGLFPRRPNFEPPCTHNLKILGIYGSKFENFRQKWVFFIHFWPVLFVFCFFHFIFFFFPHPSSITLFLFLIPYPLVSSGEPGGGGVLFPQNSLGSVKNLKSSIFRFFPCRKLATCVVQRGVLKRAQLLIAGTAACKVQCKIWYFCHFLRWSFGVGNSSRIWRQIYLKGLTTLCQ